MSNRVFPGARPTARSGRRSAAFLAALATLGLAACGDEQADPLAPSATSFSRAAPGATFDWSMPARFGPDGNGDGLIDYPSPDEIAPSSWRVDFNACAVPGDEYTWYVDRIPVAMVDGCEYAHEFEAEGTYQVALHVVSAPGASVWAEETVTVQDWLIVSFGDSYASGEGVPEVRAASPALVAEIMGLIQDLQEAKQQLALAQSSLQSALEEKGLAQDILSGAQSQLNAFLNACTINEFKDIKVCADHLAGLPFSTFNAAKAHFDQAVQNAQERLSDAIAAVQAAQAAIAAAQSAVTSLTAAIQAAQGGFAPPRWQSKFAVEEYDHPQECHRSGYAAPARAALAVEQADPRTSVTFVHLACSGAVMEGGRASLSAQIKWADALVGDREVDAVLVSIGGNDAGFSTLATACATQEPCFADNPVIDLAAVVAACGPLGLLGFGQSCTKFFEDNVPTKSAKQVLAEGLAELPGGYARVANEWLPLLGGLLEPRSGGQVLEGGRPVQVPDRVRSERVYITEYVDMTKNQGGAYCGGPNPGDPFGAMPGFSVAEMSWLDQTATKGINGAVASAAGEHGWNYVTGIYGGYAKNGYCAQPHWVVRLHESRLGQGDMNGMAHPNRAGHQFNGAAIQAELMADLYPAGPGAPRPPDHPAASVLAGGDG